MSMQLVNKLLNLQIQVTSNYYDNSIWTVVVDYQRRFMYRCPRHKAHLIISFEWTTIFQKLILPVMSSITAVSYHSNHCRQICRSYHWIYHQQWNLPSFSILLYRSTVLKHNGREFVVHNQTLRTHDSLSVAFVSDSSVDPVTQHHLVAFSSYSYRTRYDLPSYSYRCNNSTQRFGINKSLPSTGATNIRFFLLIVNFI